MSDTLNLFETSIDRETQIITDLRACIETLGEVISRSDVLLPLRNEIATRCYDLELLQRQRDQYRKTGCVIDIAVIREEYRQEIKTLFLCEEVASEVSPEIEHSVSWYRCPSCHSDNPSIILHPCNQSTVPNMYHTRKTEGLK